MTLIADPLSCLGMAKHEPVVKKGVNFRLPVPLIEELEKFVEKHTPETSQGAVVAAALREFFDKHAPEKPVLRRR
jgi:hypothetical protein